MARPKLVVINSEQSEHSRGGRDGRMYRFELSRKKLLLYTTGLIASLCWMFIFGVLVGRGVALVGSDDFSLKGEFARFLGLDKQVGQPSSQASETWGDPRKMLESLNYYEDLTKQGGVPVTAPPKPVDLPPDAVEPVKETTKEPVSRRAAAAAAEKSPTSEKTPAPPAPEKPLVAAQPEKTASKTPAPSSVPYEQYTLLVASLKDAENAQRLIDQLNTKGYKPRLEALDLNGGGRWNRVLVGSFQSREAAIKFAAEFNKKENMEGLVIRDQN